MPGPEHQERNRPFTMPTSNRTARTMSRRASAPKSETTQPSKPSQVPERELTELQQYACSLAGDLITRGGDEDNVDDLLRALTGHMVNGFLGRPDPDLSKLVEGWRRQLTRFWPEPAGPKTAQPLPLTVSEKMLFTLRERLEDRFKDFMGTARAHEMLVLVNIFETRYSCSRGPDSSDAESPLAEAFMNELGVDHTLVKVQRGHVKQVEEFVALLNEADPPAPEVIDAKN